MTQIPQAGTAVGPKWVHCPGTPAHAKFVFTGISQLLLFKNAKQLNDTEYGGLPICRGYIPRYPQC